MQCGVVDLNRDPVKSVLRAGPQPGSCEFSVACRTSTGYVRERMSEDMSERMSKDMSERMSEDMSERLSEDIQKECQKTCQKE